MFWDRELPGWGCASIPRLPDRPEVIPAWWRGG